MSIRKPSGVKRKVPTMSPRKSVLHIIGRDSVRDEYAEVLEFALRVNMDKGRINGAVLNEAARKTVESATRKYILAGQARNIAPQELKRKILESARKDRSHRNWKADVQLEQKYNFMAGSSYKVKS